MEIVSVLSSENPSRGINVNSVNMNVVNYDACDWIGRADLEFNECRPHRTHGILDSPDPLHFLTLCSVFAALNSAFSTDIIIFYSPSY